MFSWGWAVEKLNIKLLFFLIAFVEIFDISSIYLITENNFIFSLEILFMGFCLGATISSLLPFFTKVFGKNYGIEIFGLTRIFVGLSSLVGSLACKLIIKEEKDYFKVYLLGASINLVVLIILPFYNENENFIFKDRRFKGLQSISFIQRKPSIPTVDDALF